MQRLLRRQLAKLGLSESVAPDLAQWRALIGRVLHTYGEADQDRYTLERSLMMSSTEMHDLHAELRRSEANFKALVESLPSAIFVQEEDTPRARYANPAMAALVGLDDPRELIGVDVLQAFIHPADREKLHDARYRRKDAHAVSDQVRVVRRDGGVVIAQGHYAPITFDGGPACLCVLRDMTERVRAEEDLKASEERYRRLFEASPHPMYLFDKRTLQFRAVNDAAVRLYGYSRDEFLKRKLTDLKPPEETAAFVQRMSDATGEPSGAPIVIGPRRHLKKDGTLVEVDVTSHAVSLGEEHLGLAICVDVTERRRLENQLRQAQKMEAIGRLAGGIAHDFNNILAVILGDAELALDALATDHPARADIQEIEAAGRRAALLTQQLLTFSRRQPCRPQTLALNTVVTNLEKMLCRVLGEDIEISATLAPRLGAIQADPGQIEQVLLNLVVNARDAMPLGGRLGLETANVLLDPPHAAEMGLAPGDYVVLCVTDNGTGMDAATVARAFEPFFTTKDVGKGTGLGLSTVHGIVEHAGGAIAVSSIPGQGSTFRVHFPRAAGAHESVNPRPASSTRGSETVLVVEDEEQVRRVVCRLLTSRGYCVLEANSAHAALELLRWRERPVDLIVTDLVMPEMDGRRMAAQVQDRNPRVKVLYMSGYTEHATMSGPALGPLDHFIHKPFTMEEMANAVRRVLEGRRPSSSTLAAVGAVG